MSLHHPVIAAALQGNPRPLFDLGRIALTAHPDKGGVEATNALFRLNDEIEVHRYSDYLKRVLGMDSRIS